MSILYFILFAINTIFIIINARIEYTKGSPFSLFWIGYFFNYFIYMVFDYGVYNFQATPRTAVVSVDSETLITAQFFILIFSLLAFSYLCITKTQFHNLKQVNLDVRVPNFIPVMVITLFISRMTFKFYSGDQSQDFVEFRENANVTSLLFDTYFKYIFVGTIVYFAVVQRYLFVFLLLMLLLLDFVMFGGGRQFFLLAIIGLISATLITKKFSFSIFFITFASIPVGVFLAKILVFLRNLPDYQSRLDFLTSFDWSLVQRSTTNEYDLRFAFYHFIERQVDLTDAFFSLSYFARILLFWLPSSISAGLKPTDFEYDMYEFYAGEFGGSLHATFHGTIFADSGWFILPWIFLFILVREFAAKINFKSNSAANIIFWFSLVYLSVMWARGSIYAPMVVNLFILITLFIAIFFQNIFIQNQSSPPPLKMIRRLVQDN